MSEDCSCPGNVHFTPFSFLWDRGYHFSVSEGSSYTEVVLVLQKYHPPNLWVCGGDVLMLVSPPAIKENLVVNYLSLASFNDLSEQLP